MLTLTKRERWYDSIEGSIRTVYRQSVDSRVSVWHSTHLLIMQYSEFFIMQYSEYNRDKYCTVLNTEKISS